LRATSFFHDGGYSIGDEAEFLLQFLKRDERALSDRAL